MNYTLLEAQTFLIGFFACIGALCVVTGAVGLFFLLRAWFAQEKEARRLKTEKATQQLEQDQMYERAASSLIEFAEDLLKEK